MVPDRGEQDLSARSAEYELFVNASYMSRVKARAVHNLYLCYFPTPFDHDSAAGGGGSCGGSARTSGVGGRARPDGGSAGSRRREAGGGCGRGPPDGLACLSQVAASG